MAKEDISKTGFKCPRFLGLFEWIVMTFGLKNAGATYQRVMNLFLHDFLDVIVEVYIDEFGATYQRVMNFVFGDISV
jgi:hypothetical protein